MKPARAEVPGEDAYRFRHSLICDETYAGIPKAVRAELHERFARWLQAQAREGRGFGEHDEILAYHLEQAHRYRTELVPADDHALALAGEAGALLAVAGRRALAREDLPAAVVMFERALALLPANAADRSRLLTELGSAAMRAGEWERAHALLDEAISSAKQVGDRRSELRATIELQWQRSYTEPEGAAEEDRRVAEALIPELERLEDDLGLAKALWLLSESHLIAGRWQERADALERAIRHARKASDEGQALVLVVQFVQAMYYGPTPVPEALRRCAELFEAAPASPTFEAGLATTIAGTPRDGREVRRRAGVVRRLGRGLRRVRAPLPASGPIHAGGADRDARGDPVAAEQELRVGYAMLEEMGEQGARSTVAAMLADVLSIRADDAETERFVQIARETAADTDVMTQVLWRRALARASARQGDAATAEALAREALRLSETTDSLDLRAGSLVALADVLREAGTPADGDGHLDEARALYEAKGNSAAMARLAARHSVS